MSLRFLTAGESHGPCLTVIVEGLPAGIPVTSEMIDADLAKRQLKAGAGGRMTIETDHAEILAGVMQGKTTGAPVALQIKNKDFAAWQGKEIPAYTIPRPGHADLSACVKYGFDDIRPSLERSSARETACRVAAGALARLLLKHFGITANAYVASLGSVREDQAITTQEAQIYSASSPTRAPNQSQDEAYQSAITAAKKAGETLGGVLTCVVNGLPIGLGSYVAADRRLDARIGAAVLSIQAMKGVEFANAFENTHVCGSQLHDAIVRNEAGDIIRETDRAGGLEAGMTTGQPLIVRAAMKPIPTTLTPQQSVDLASGVATQTAYERSDTCPVPRACVVLESVVLFELASALLDKLGGDTLETLISRYQSLPSASDVKLSSKPKCFWA